MNDKIEAELVEFKEEIERNFWKSEINRTYRFVRLPDNEAVANSKNVSSANKIKKSRKDGKNARGSMQMSLSSQEDGKGSKMNQAGDSNKKRKM